MKGIQITEEIKDKNPVLWVQAAALNQIILRGDYPNRFYMTENVIGGYRERVDLHSLDGWKDFVLTPFDSAIERQGSNIIEVDGNYTYEIISLTAQEQDNLIAQQEQEQDEQEEQEHEEAGEALIKRCRRRLRRRVKKGNISENQSNKLRRWFSQIFYHLKLGDWDLAQEDILSETFPAPTNEKLVTEIEWFKVRIADYMQTEFNRKS